MPCGVVVRRAAILGVRWWLKMAKMNELLMYQTEDGKTKIEVRYQDETVWASEPRLERWIGTSTLAQSTDYKL